MVLETCRNSSSLTGHIPLRNPKPEAPGRMHLRARVSGGHATAGKRPGADRHADQQRAEPWAEEKSLTRVEADAEGQEQEGERHEHLVQEGLAWGQECRIEKAATSLVPRKGMQSSASAALHRARGDILMVSSHYRTFVTPCSGEHATSQSSAECLATKIQDPCVKTKLVSVISRWELRMVILEMEVRTNLLEAGRGRPA